MWRLFFVAALAATIWTGRPALAQPPSSKDDVKKLEAELDKLRSQMKDVEARLEKAKNDKRPASWGRFGPWGPMAWSGHGMHGPWGGWSHRDGRSSEANKSSDVEKRLDRILREVEDLRREIKKK